MLKKEERMVNHPVLGKIQLDEKFSKVLDLAPFRNLAFKSQLGVRWLSRLGTGNRTRLMHSLGVYELTTELLKKCEEKFCRYFSITEQDWEAIQLAALAHDLGHHAFSHTLEYMEEETHEERTIKWLKEYAKSIDEIFGYAITSMAISILEENREVKNSGYQNDSVEEIDIKFIFKSLLVGAIDCDRMEYVMADKLAIYGKWNDYRSLLRYITIVLLKDKPMVGFENEAVPAIENFLMERFDLYRYDYFKLENVIADMALNCYSQLEARKGRPINQMSEQQIVAELQTIWENRPERTSKEYRLAEIIVGGKRDNLMAKRLENEEKFNDFIVRLKAILPPEFILTTKRSVSVYNPKKNRIYVRDNNGIFRDIKEVSIKIGDMSVNYYYVMVDCEPGMGLTEEQIKKVKELFENNSVEIEKKFTLPEDNSFQDYFNKENSWVILTNIIMRIKEGSILQDTKLERVQNNDQYYDVFLRGEKTEKIAVRHRKSEEEECWYVKMPVYDGTSITKRFEYKFHCKTEEEIKYAIAQILKENQSNIKLREGVSINTTRSRQMVDFFGSKIEMSCDFSEYTYKGRQEKGLMLECELKQGDEMALWYLAKMLKDIGFIETNDSKEKRAKKALGLDQ